MSPPRGRRSREFLRAPAGGSRRGPRSRGPGRKSPIRAPTVESPRIQRKAQGAGPRSVPPRPSAAGPNFAHQPAPQVPPSARRTSEGLEARRARGPHTVPGRGSAKNEIARPSFHATSCIRSEPAATRGGEASALSRGQPCSRHAQEKIERPAFPANARPGGWPPARSFPRNWAARSCRRATSASFGGPSRRTDRIRAVQGRRGGWAPLPRRFAGSQARFVPAALRRSAPRTLGSKPSQLSCIIVTKEIPPPAPWCVVAKSRGFRPAARPPRHDFGPAPPYKSRIPPR